MNNQINFTTLDFFEIIPILDKVQKNKKVNLLISDDISKVLSVFHFFKERQETFCVSVYSGYRPQNYAFPTFNITVLHLNSTTKGVILRKALSYIEEGYLHRFEIKIDKKELSIYPYQIYNIPYSIKTGHIDLLRKVSKDDNIILYTLIDS